MQKESILGEAIFTINDFLTADECAAYRGESEERGYEEATISSLRGAVLRSEVRNNSRVIFNDPELARAWFERARPFLPEQLGQWHVAGLNERFRYYRYDPGQSFKRHYDASFHRSNGDQSFLTFMVYLNDGYEGGTTDFYHADDRPRASVAPRSGMALVFDHLQVHEGSAVLSGRKYVLRTDVMYTRRR